MQAIELKSVENSFGLGALNSAQAVLALVFAACLAGCGGGGGGSNGSSNTAQVTAPNGRDGFNALVVVLVEPPGSNCSTGGSRISAGLDANANSILEATEVTSVQFVCNGMGGSNGAQGSSGLTSLVALKHEPAGANCAAGGTKINVGIDANSSGSLDSSEVSSSDYVCQSVDGVVGATGATGLMGPTGASGSSGINSLVATAAVAPGSVCANGGTKIITGLDTNGNGLLDVAEAASTGYVCNGADGTAGTQGVAGATGAMGPVGATGAQGAAGVAGALGPAGMNSLVLLTVEPAGSNCSNGGSKISTGIDVNANGQLDNAEVGSVGYACTGATGATGAAGTTGAVGPAGSAGKNSLVALLPEPAGANCPSGGSKVSVGTDTNSNGLLDNAEVISAGYVCDGANGAQGVAGAIGPVGAAGASGSTGPAGMNSLVLIDIEAAGVNCPTGGSKISSGTDLNANGTLDNSEVTSIGYVCRGATGSAGTIGATGATGTAGKNSLLKLTAEPAGVNCSNGGNKVSTGTDLNSNGLLDDAEVDAVGYVCNGSAGAAGATGAIGSTGATGVAGAAGSNSLVRLTAESAGSNCASSGSRIDTGIDANSNGVLDNGEIASTGYVCQGTTGATGSAGATGAAGAAGAKGLTSLIVIVSESAGANCTYGGNKVTSGLDANDDNILGVAEIQSTAYVCNGAPGPGISWNTVSGTSTVAQSNSGYIAANDATAVTVTLPSTPAIGDLVRVVGAGAAGWRIAQNAGQSVITTNLPGAYLPAGLDWTAGLTSENVYDIACSLDGTKLVAGGLTGIFTSTDSGVSWTAQVGSPTVARAVASSTDGSKLVAVRSGGQIYTSIDSGATWNARDSTRNWTDVASSTDGAVLVATVDDSGGGGIYTSTNSGVTWAVTSAPNLGWKTVAVSSDGQKMVASTGGAIYTSIDGGANWISRRSLPATSVASSADGKNLIAGMGGNVSTDGVFTSNDYGVTWARRLSGTDSDLTKGTWSPVAVSADGVTMMASGLGQWHISRDSGRTWIAMAHEYLGNVKGLAMSRDASKIATAVSGGTIFGVYSSVASGARTTTGTSGSLSGGQYDSIEVQYVGGGLFIVLNYNRYSTSGFGVQ